MTDLSPLAQFYRALQERDYATIRVCYHPEVRYHDPVFTLRGLEVPAMWHMLGERGKDMRFEWQIQSATSASAEGHWEPIYTFGGSGRRVHNVIDTRVAFRDSQIIEHVDSFGFWRWARQALGLPGLLLGWTPLLPPKVQATARKGLAAFIAQHPEYQT